MVWNLSLNELKGSKFKSPPKPNFSLFSQNPNGPLHWVGPIRSTHLIGPGQAFKVKSGRVGLLVFCIVLAQIGSAYLNGFFFF
jgi:hypothetical protein